MIRNFLKLLVLILIPIVWLFFSEFFNPIRWVAENVLAKFNQSVYSGSFYLLEREFLQRPQSEWPALLARLDPEYGYDINILNLQDAHNNWGINSLPEHDQIISRTNDDIEALFKRLGDTDYLLMMMVDESIDSGIAHKSQGTIARLKSYLSEYSPADYPNATVDLQKHFDFPLHWVDKNPDIITRRNQHQIEQWGYFWHGQDAVTFYITIDDSNRWLVLGPTPSNQWVIITYFSGLIISVLVTFSLALLIWLYPLWRDLKQLDKTSQDFGNGKLDVRSNIRKSSIASRLSQSFNGMANDIQTLIQSNRELTNAVAHDLRTPLARLRFAIEMLEQTPSESDDATRYYTVVSKSINDLDYLVNQLLTHSRYSRSVDSSHFKEENLAELITEEINVFSPEYPSISVEFTCDEYFNSNKIFIDSRAITRALQNLFSNAIRFARQEIAVTLSCVDSMVILSVEDDGVGIDLAIAEQLLLPFSQVDNDERNTRQGHGLGLAIVNQISQWHKGKTDIQRSPLGGAKIILSWPLKPLS